MSLPDYTQPQASPRGRLLILLPGLPLLVFHERIRNQVIKLAEPYELARAWDHLPRAVQIDLTHDGQDHITFTRHLVAEYHRIAAGEDRQFLEGI